MQLTKLLTPVVSMSGSRGGTPHTKDHLDLLERVVDNLAEVSEAVLDQRVASLLLVIPG